MMNEEQIRAYFASQRQWVTQFLTGLLAIPSESGDERRAQEYLLAQFQQIEGLACICEPVHNSIKEDPEYSFPVRDLDYTGRGNLIVRKKGQAGGRTLSLNTHVDVVPPSAGQARPYEPRLDGRGMVWARGACDAKGQVAALALLLKAAAEHPNQKNSIVAHVVLEEELGGNGTLAALRSSPDFTADAMVNLEPTDLRVSPSIRGAVWFDMTFTGIAGHAGSSKNTFSATDKAIAAVALMKAYHRELLERSRGCGLFAGIDNPMPLTIGIFQAGVWPAMVPGEARIAGVLGFLPNMTKQKVMGEIRALFDREENRWISDGMHIDFVYRHNAVETPAGHWLTRGMSQACERCGVDGTPVAMTASSDAVYYFERGIPALAFGPGKIPDAHSSHECVAIDDVLRAGEILYTFYQSM